MERIRLRFRCDLRWEELEGEDPRERHCGECGQSVINLSSLTRPEAERLLADRVRARGADRVCVRFVQGADGRVEYAEPVGEPRRRLRVLGELGAAAALATVISLPRPAHADLSSEVRGKPGSASTARRADPPKPPPAATTTASNTPATVTARKVEPPPKRPLMGKPVLHPTRELMGDIAE